MSSSPAAAGESTSCCCAAATSADLVRWRRAGRGRNQSRRTDASLANRRAPPPPPDPTARALPRHSRPPLQIFPVRTGLSAGTVGPSPMEELASPAGIRTRPGDKGGLARVVHGAGPRVRIRFPPPASLRSAASSRRETSRERRGQSRSRARYEFIRDYLDFKLKRMKEKTEREK